MIETDFAIKTKDLRMEFGKRVAVNSINLEIKKGQIFALLGTNGAGKTTTIKMLCCLLSPTSGTASVMGYDVKNDPMKVKRIIGVSPQETAIGNHLTTFENLMLMGGVFGISRIETKARAKKLMDLLELEDRKDQARKLSGGMQRRLSIAMALMSDPDVVFLDEPTLGLDPHARKSVWNYIEKLKGEKTILLTTHYLEEADALSDEIAIIEKSNIIETGTSRELKMKYNSFHTLDISCEGVSEAVINGLSDMKMDALRTDYGIQIKVDQPDFYGIIDFLKLHKISIKKINMQEPSLDDVFLKLTGKEAEK
jgi:ABC-2 type transport system ATP-binding protein